MCLSTYYLEYGRHLARLHRRRRRRRAYAPTSNIASHDNHEKINSWVSFYLLYEYGAPFGGPSGRRSSARYYLALHWVGKEEHNAFSKGEKCFLQTSVDNLQIMNSLHCYIGFSRL